MNINKEEVNKAIDALTSINQEGREQVRNLVSKLTGVDLKEPEIKLIVNGLYRTDVSRPVGGNSIKYVLVLRDYYNTEKYVLNYLSDQLESIGVGGSINYHQALDMLRKDKCKYEGRAKLTFA